MTMLEQLQAIDPSMLLNVVRQDQRSPDFVITDWTVGILSDKGASHPEGLFCFSGHGRDGQGVRPWSVALKVLSDPGQPFAVSDWWYWKRELLVNQSGLLARLPSPLVAPRCYGTREYERGAWIWMERITESTAGRWGLDKYTFAANQLGRFNGVYLSGTPLSDFPWLTRRAVLSWITVWSPEVGWDSPYVLRHISNQVRERIMGLWVDRDHFLSVLDHLPQTFSHFDFHRRNLLIRTQADGREELVAVDWAMCGIGPLGGDASMLMGMSSMFFDWEPAAIRELEVAVFDSYLAGLRDAGWRGNPLLVRLGFITWTALWLGVVMPHAIAVCAAEERRADELASGWAKICEFALDRADEARHLMGQLMPA
jgi:hypothetical protein